MMSEEKSAHMSAWEKETIINMNAEEKEASIYSCEPRIWHRCEKIGLEAKKVIKNDEGLIVSKEYYCPKKWIKIKKPAKRREMTEEEKKKFWERMKESRTS